METFSTEVNDSYVFRITLVAAQWVTNYLVSWTLPMLDKSSSLIGIFHHSFAYWMHGLMAAFAGFIMWKLVPGTKGKSLEQMEMLWDKNKAVIVP